VIAVQKARSFDTWLWIPELWLLLYSLLTIVAYASTILIGHELYWLVFTIGVPIVIVPATYRNLVGGVPMSAYPPADATARASRALVDILKLDGL